MKEINITINTRNKDQFDRITCRENESILNAFIRQGIIYPADCGNRGTCGKCKIQILKIQDNIQNSIQENKLSNQENKQINIHENPQDEIPSDSQVEISIMDRKIFSEEELAQGFRLSCQAYPKEDIIVNLLSDEEVTNYDAVSEYTMSYSSVSQGKHTGRMIEKNSYSIGIDLGTTTIAVCLIHNEDNRILRTNTFANCQRAYGADIISRIKASNDGKREVLCDIIRAQLLEGIFHILAEEGVRTGSVNKIAIAGNTTMLHLFMGYSCKSLGVYPFRAINLGPIQEKFQEIYTQREINTCIASLLQESEVINSILRMLLDCEINILPGISAFVGGDITAGLYACGFHQNDKICLLIDLGTNGEMAIGNKNHILVTSAAAGPAFEGVNLSCGVGSIPGAIAHININGDYVNYQTIKDKPPIGICGTGMIDLAAELLKEKKMDETGLLADEYFENGYRINPYHQVMNDEKSVEFKNDTTLSSHIIVTQKDIRELQLAKAAIRAGVEILLKQYHIGIEQLDTVYLAGGFGYKMDITKAVKIGLLPEKMQSKIKAVGNSSLAGIHMFLQNEDAIGDMNHMISSCEEMNLSEDIEFNDFYINYMNFI